MACRTSDEECLIDTASSYDDETPYCRLDVRSQVNHGYSAFIKNDYDGD